MFSERLENLIKATLQDGILTDQEKAAIIKRAQAEGEDIEEIDIYIQSLMQKRQQQLIEETQNAAKERLDAQKKETEAKLREQAEAQKERDMLMRKCPVCGSRIPPLTNICPECNSIYGEENTDEKLTRLIRGIHDASEKMYSHFGQIRFNSGAKYISKEMFEGLSSEEKAYVRIRPSFKSRPERYIYEKKINNYFQDLWELVNCYGGLPIVQKIESEQKTKRMNLVSREFANSIRDSKQARLSLLKEQELRRAEDSLKELKKTYGSMTEVQLLIPKYEQMYEEGIKDLEERKIIEKKEKEEEEALRAEKKKIEEQQKIEEAKLHAEIEAERTKMKEQLEREKAEAISKLHAEINAEREKMKEQLEREKAEAISNIHAEINVEREKMKEQLEREKAEAISNIHAEINAEKLAIEKQWKKDREVIISEMQVEGKEEPIAKTIFKRIFNK